MRVIGIDPGYDRLGVAVLDFDGQKETLVYSCCITTEKGTSIPDRLLVLGEAFSKILTTYKPDIVGVEAIFFNKNQKTAVSVAEARGIVLYLARKNNCLVEEYTPQAIKVAVTGYGKSNKNQVMEMVKRILPNTPENALDDEYDAIATAITCIAYNRTFKVKKTSE